MTKQEVYWLIAKLLCPVCQVLLVWADVRRRKRGIVLDGFTDWIVTIVVVLLFFVNMLI